nr:MAG TPA: hypothetical protein [Caudoviricetes sp.]
MIADILIMPENVKKSVPKFKQKDSHRNSAQ